MSDQPEQHRVNAGPAGNLDLDWLFTYHAPRADQVPLFEAMRDQGKQLAVLIATLCPPGPDRSLAISRVREAIMWANSAIANAKPPAEEEETVEVAVTLPNARARCQHYSEAEQTGYSRCVRARGHDEPAGDVPGTPHVDQWGQQWVITDGRVKVTATLPRDRVEQIVADEGTRVTLT